MTRPPREAQSRREAVNQGQAIAHRNQHGEVLTTRLRGRRRGLHDHVLWDRVASEFTSREKAGALPVPHVPAFQQLILAQVAQHALGMPRSY